MATNRQSQEARASGFRISVAKLMLLPVVAAPISCCLFRCGPVEWGFSQGNYEREGIVTVHAVDGGTKQPIDNFRVLFTYGDRNSDPRFNQVRAIGSAGTATFAITYPTLNYRSQGRPAGYTFFGKDYWGDYSIRVIAEGYGERTIRLPEYVVSGREFPPPELPPVTVELERTADEDRDKP